MRPEPQRPEPQRPELEALAEAQAGLFRRTQAFAAGYTRADLDRLLASRAWEAVARGTYATADTVAALRGHPVGGYLLRCAARRLQFPGDSVLSHESAAVLHGIALLDPVTGPPRLTVPAPRAGTRGGLPGRFVAAVPADQRCEVLGVPVTTPARTVVDLARVLSLEAAMVSADAALRAGLDRGALFAVLDACRGWPGLAQAKQVTVMASRWSESALESLAMVWFRAQSLPLPQQQLTVRRTDGRWLARVDFVWPAYRTVCEVDGQRKYVDDAVTLLPTGQAIARGKALWREKLREDALRDVGLEVVRGYWTDRADGGAALAERLRRAFARGQAAPFERAYRTSDERTHAHAGPLAPYAVR
jgi:hypothetical protein